VEHVPAFLIHASECDLEPEALGAGYSGPESYRAGGDFSTRDRTVKGGVWSYDGRLASENAGAGHQLWLVLSGEIRLTIGGQALEAKSGDVILMEFPYPEKTLDASRDFRAVWISVEPRSDS
jgi:mannose-6-phosphate isomerase-like protein (cupin superfamily)